MKARPGAPRVTFPQVTGGEGLSSLDAGSLVVVPHVCHAAAQHAPAQVATQTRATRCWIGVSVPMNRDFPIFRRRFR